MSAYSGESQQAPGPLGDQLRTLTQHLEEMLGRSYSMHLKIFGPKPAMKPQGVEADPGENITTTLRRAQRIVTELRSLIVEVEQAL